MEEKLITADKEALADIVKLSQKRGMKGEKGGWKEFLKSYDKRLGTSLSDPAKRSKEDLLAFLRTFKEDDDLKIFDKLLLCRSNRQLAKELLNSNDSISPELKLVQLTYQHPEYPNDYSFPSHEEDWVITKLRKKHLGKPYVLLAVDCEMVLCEDGSDALVKICVVDRNCQEQLHEFVKPDKTVVDYRTSITGISADDLSGVTKSLTDIQKCMKKLLSNGTILVGHGLSNDLRALKMDHCRVIDTSSIFNYGGEHMKRRPSLNDVSKFVLGHSVREKGAPHNCKDDACAAMKIVLAKIEDGVDNMLPMEEEHVPEDEKAKLLVHRIPISMPSESLRNFIKGEFTIVVQEHKKGRGDRYSARIIFRTPQEAFQAFEDVQGNEEKDSSGKPQKSISIKVSNEATDTIYIRKMIHNSAPPGHVSTSPKRERTPTPAEENSKTKKVPKIDVEAVKAPEKISTSCDGHVEEIKWLKDTLRHRDKEISNLHKIIAALTRKHGL